MGTSANDIGGLVDAIIGLVERNDQQSYRRIMVRAKNGVMPDDIKKTNMVVFQHMEFLSENEERSTDEDFLKSLKEHLISCGEIGDLGYSLIILPSQFQGAIKNHAEKVGGAHLESYNKKVAPFVSKLLEMVSTMIGEERPEFAEALKPENAGKAAAMGKKVAADSFMTKFMEMIKGSHPQVHKGITNSTTSQFFTDTANPLAIIYLNTLVEGADQVSEGKQRIERIGELCDGLSLSSPIEGLKLYNDFLQMLLTSSGQNEENYPKVRNLHDALAEELNKYAQDASIDDEVSNMDFVEGALNALEPDDKPDVSRIFEVAELAWNNGQKNKATHIAATAFEILMSDAGALELDVNKLLEGLSCSEEMLDEIRDQLKRTIGFGMDWGSNIAQVYENKGELLINKMLKHEQIYEAIFSNDDTLISRGATSHRLRVVGLLTEYEESFSQERLANFFKVGLALANEETDAQAVIAEHDRRFYENIALFGESLQNGLKGKKAFNMFIDAYYLTKTHSISVVQSKNGMSNESIDFLAFDENYIDYFNDNDMIVLEPVLPYVKEFVYYSTNPTADPITFTSDPLRAGHLLSRFVKESGSSAKVKVTTLSAALVPSFGIEDEDEQTDGSEPVEIESVVTGQPTPSATAHSGLPWFIYSGFASNADHATVIKTTEAVATQKTHPVYMQLLEQALDVPNKKYVATLKTDFGEVVASCSEFIVKVHLSFTDGDLPEKEVFKAIDGYRQISDYVAQGKDKTTDNIVGRLVFLAAVFSLTAKQFSSITPNLKKKLDEYAAFIEPIITELDPTAFAQKKKGFFGIFG